MLAVGDHIGYNCYNCRNLMIRLEKYKKYKTRLKVKRSENKRLRSILETLNARYYSNSVVSSVIPECEQLGSDIRKLIEHNEELEHLLGLKREEKMDEIPNHSPDDFNLPEMKETRQEPPTIFLMQQMLSIQENIEKMLSHEVKFLRGIVEAQQKFILEGARQTQEIMPSSSSLRSDDESTDSGDDERKVSADQRFCGAVTTVEQPNSTSDAIRRLSAVVKTAQSERDLSSISTRECKNEQKLVSVPPSCHQVSTVIPGSTQGGAGTGTGSARKTATLAKARTKQKSSRMAAAALQEEVDKILKEISGVDA